MKVYAAPCTNARCLCYGNPISKRKVDADGRMGLYILTGSQQFGPLTGIRQSLAGRTAFVALLPFSFAELARAGRLPGKKGRDAVK